MPPRRPRCGTTRRCRCRGVPHPGPLREGGAHGEGGPARGEDDSGRIRRGQAGEADGVLCLQTLADAPGITGSELARRVFVSRQSMNVLLQGLEKKGLVERSPDPGPRRERAASLTDAAAGLVVDARQRVATVAERMTGGLDAAAQRRLEAALRACRDALAD